MTGAALGELSPLAEVLEATGPDTAAGAIHSSAHSAADVCASGSGSRQRARLVHGGGADEERRVREIAAAYCRRFEQESVMRVTDRVRADFLGADAAAAGSAAVDQTPPPASPRSPR